MLQVLSLALLAASAFAEVEDKVAAFRQERGLQAAVAVAGPGYWGQAATAACPGSQGPDGTCLSNAYGLGSTICTGAGSTISIWKNSAATVIPANFVIPPECQASPKTTQTECTAINNLWNTKFAYCCPYWAGYYNAGRNFYPQLNNANDPKAIMPFFNRGYSDFLTYIGLPGLVAAKWIGNVNWQGQGGCRMFYNCAGNLNKASCKAAGGMCVWQKNVCVNNPYTVSLVNTYTVSPTTSG
jgi:hypothetical protein